MMFQSETIVPEADVLLICSRELCGGTMQINTITPAVRELASGLKFPGAVSDIWPDGTRVDQYLLPDPMVTNVCFGGPELATAFATLSLRGRLVAFDWPRPGAPLKHLNRP